MRTTVKVGDKYGRLLIIKESSKKIRRRTAFECLCDCGNICIKDCVVLKNGHTKSCGCFRVFTTKKRCFKGYQEISGRYFCNLKENAKIRNLEFSITLEDVWNLFLEQNRKCALSKVDIRFATNSKDKLGTASLDRIDSSKGYIDGNIQWVHKLVNIMKQDMTDEEFINWCKIIAKNN